MATEKRLLKLTIMQYRNPSLSEAEFNLYWTEKHAPLSSAWVQRNGILKYTQYHTPMSTRSLAFGFAESLGWQIAPYDGHVEFVVQSMDDLYKAVQDPDYPARVGPDEQKFLDVARSTVTVGWEEVYVLNGEVINIKEERSVYAGKDSE